MTRIAQRLLARAATGLAIAVTLVVAPTAPAFATQECMFLVLPGLGTSSECPPVARLDDRTMSTPTSWWTYQSVDAATVSDLLGQHLARPTDLRVVSTSPVRFSVTMVRNSGDYASSYWWYYGISKSQVDGFLSDNQARLVSAVRYGSAYTVVMVPDEGAPPSDWCDTDFAGIGACLGTDNRLTNIVSYAANRFVVIFVNNAAGPGWCWWAGISRSQLSTLCAGQSVVDVSANADGTFNMATVAADGDGRVRDFATPAALVSYALSAPPDRALFVTPYTANGATRWLTSLRRNS